MQNSLADSSWAEMVTTTGALVLLGRECPWMNEHRKEAPLWAHGRGEPEKQVLGKEVKSMRLFSL